MLIDRPHIHIIDAKAATLDISYAGSLGISEILFYPQYQLTTSPYARVSTYASMLSSHQKAGATRTS